MPIQISGIRIIPHNPGTLGGIEYAEVRLTSGEKLFFLYQIADQLIILRVRLISADLFEDLFTAYPSLLYPEQIGMGGSCKAIKLPIFKSHQLMHLDFSLFSNLDY